MPYEPPPYEMLHLATSDVQQNLNGFCRRYVSPSYDQLRERIGGMDILYRRYIREKGNRLFGLSPDPVRLEEIACITQLVEHLPTVTAVSPERNQVQNVILGALIYRRLAIMASYHETPVGRVKDYLPAFLKPIIGEETSSALYRTIQEVLSITPDNSLDELSIATCCRAYLNYLRGIQAERKSPYIRDEPDFFTQIERFTLNAEVESRGLAEQVKHLMSIQFVASMLRTTDAEISQGLATLSEALSAVLARKKKLATLNREEIVECMTSLEIVTLPDALTAMLSTKSTLNREEIMEGMASLEIATLPDVLTAMLSTKSTLNREEIMECMASLTLSDRVKAQISDLLPDDLSELLFDNDVLTEENAREFVPGMKRRLERNSQYVLLGTYVVVLNETQAIYPNLRLAINTAIGALRPGNHLQTEDQYWPLMALNNYLRLPNIAADFDFRPPWRSLEAFQLKVRTQALEVQRIRDMAAPISDSMIATGPV